MAEKQWLSVPENWETMSDEEKDAWAQSLLDSTK